MDQGLAALIGAIIGGAAVILSNVIMEWQRRRGERKAIASAFAGEIYSLLDMTEKRGYVATFEGMLEVLDKGVDLPIMDFIPGDPLRAEPVAAAYLSKIGSLGDDLPEKIVLFYTYLSGIRVDIKRLSTGEFGGNPAAKARIIRESLALWKENIKRGQELVRLLRKL